MNSIAITVRTVILKYYAYMTFTAPLAVYDKVLSLKIERRQSLTCDKLVLIYTSCVVYVVIIST
jgi:hypothetical protein